MENLRIPSEKIQVLYQSCNPCFQQLYPKEVIEDFRQSREIPRNYLLWVGSLIERKRPLLALKALKNLPESLRIPLVIVGKGRMLPQVKDYIRRHRLGQDRPIKLFYNVLSGPSDQTAAEQLEAAGASSAANLDGRGKGRGGRNAAGRGKGRSTRIPEVRIANLEARVPGCATGSHDG